MVRPGLADQSTYLYGRLVGDFLPSGPGKTLMEGVFRAQGREGKDVLRRGAWNGGARLTGVPAADSIGGRGAMVVRGGHRRAEVTLGRGRLAWWAGRYVGGDELRPSRSLPHH